MPDDITLKIVLIVMICVLKDDGKFYPQLFLDEALFLNWTRMIYGSSYGWKNYAGKKDRRKKEVESFLIDKN